MNEYASDLWVQEYVAERFLTWTNGPPTPEGVPVYSSAAFWVDTDKGVWVNVGTWEKSVSWSEEEFSERATWSIRFRAVDWVDLRQH